MAAITHHAGRLYTGTAAERAGLDTTHFPPGVHFIESDTQKIYEWDGVAWKQLDAAVGPVFAADVFLDDGVGDSPALHFVGASNEEATLHFDDTARSLVITLEDNKAEALRIIDDGDGDIYFKITTTTGSEAVVFNEGGDDVDYRFEGIGQANALFIQGSNGYVGIGTATPAMPLHTYATSSYVVRFEANAADAFIGFQAQADDAARQLNLQMFGGAFPGNQFGIARADTATLFADGCFFTLGTKGAFDFVLGTSNIERMRLSAAGLVGIGAGLTALAQLHVDQASATGAIPVLYIDQGDLSEPHMILSMNGDDQDFPAIIELAVTGTPTIWWDESEDQFSFTKGIILEDAELDFAAASGANVITIPDAQADALHLVDAGGIEYVRVISTDAQPIIHFNQGEADVDTIISASGVTNAFAVDGATGNIGVNAAPLANVHFLVSDTTLSMPGTSYFGSRFLHIKTAGATDVTDTLYGLQARASVNHAQEIGNVYGMNLIADLADGTIGSAAVDRNLIAILSYATLTAGTIYGTVEGLQITANIDGGTVHADGAGNVYGARIRVDTEAAATIANDVYGTHIQVDDDADCGGTAYMLYMLELSNVDYGIYQSGTARHYLQGTIAIGGTDSVAAQLYVDQSSATGAIPVLYLDQADLSEEIFAVATTVGAGNPIDTAAIGTYYGKMRVNVIGVGYKYIALYNS